MPVMQLEIRHALERDRIIYNAVGFALGSGIAALFFRRLTLMIVAAGPPLLAIVFALGALGWLGFSFSDSMQLTFAARDQPGGARGRWRWRRLTNSIFERRDAMSAMSLGRGHRQHVGGTTLQEPRRRDLLSQRSDVVPTRPTRPLQSRHRGRIETNHWRASRLTSATPSRWFRCFKPQKVGICYGSA